MTVANRTFGGSIRAAGLLTVDDYLRATCLARAAHGTVAHRSSCPTESFDARGYDLRRRHVSDLEKRTGRVSVVLR